MKWFVDWKESLISRSLLVTTALRAGLGVRLHPARASALFCKQPRQLQTGADSTPYSPKGFFEAFFFPFPF